MSLAARMAGLAGWTLRHRRGVAAGAVLLAVLAAIAASTLRPSASTDLLLDDADPVSVADRRVAAAFGGEPIVVAVNADVPRLLTTGALVKLLDFEGRVARLDGVASAYGPASYLNQTIVQAERLVRDRLGPPAERADRAATRAAAAARLRGASAERAAQIGERARLAALGPVVQDYEDLLVRLGSMGLPSLSNSSFVTAVVYGPHTTPKERLRWLLPDNRHAIVIVRPRAGLGDAEIRALGRRLRALARDVAIPGARVRVAGTPLLSAAVADALQAELLRLAPIALLAMALVLLIGLRGVRGRLRPLLLVGVATVLTAGLLRLLGLQLTPALLAGLPVVAGLTLDYAVQLHARYLGARGDGRAPGQAAQAAAAGVGPVLLLSAVATALGLATLLLSPVPLIDQLGIVLALGSLVGVATVLTLGPALLSAGDRRAGRPLRLPRALRMPPAARRAALVVVGAGTVAGLLAGGGVPIESDLAKMAPASVGELREAQAVQRSLGTVGEVRVAIHAPDVTDPAVLEWMKRAGEAAATAVPALRAGPNIGQITLDQTAPDAAGIRSVLAALPRYFVGAAISPDRRDAQLAFALPLGSVREQAALLARLRAALPAAPPGVGVHATGVSAMAAASMSDLEDGRRRLLFTAVLAIALLLLVVRRRLDRVLIPLVPPLVAAGLSSAALALGGVVLSPLSATLELLVVAVGVEFGLLVEGRFRERRAEGASPGDAARDAVAGIGGATAVSAAAVAFGFGALALSSMRLLSSFGVLAAIELALCWLAAVAIVPALCVAADRARASRRVRGRGVAPLAGPACDVRS